MRLELDRPDGTRIIADHHVGPGRPMVLLHGLAGHRGEWLRVLAALDAPHAVGVDLRGHGESTPAAEDMSRQAFVDDVVALIEQLDLGAVDLVGQSVGAHTALLVAAARPDLIHRLVLVEGGLGGDGPEATAPIARWLHSWPDQFGSRQEFEQFFGDAGTVAHGWWAGLPQGRRPWRPDQLAAALTDVHAREARAEWRSVTAATLLVTGEHGVIPPAQIEEMCRTGRDVRHVVMPGVGHDLHLEDPTTLARHLAEHLAIDLPRIAR